jgi:hypothetical protein
VAVGVGEYELGMPIGKLYRLIRNPGGAVATEVTGEVKDYINNKGGKKAVVDGKTEDREDAIKTPAKKTPTIRQNKKHEKQLKR